MTQERYGNTRVGKIKAAYDDLRAAVRAHDSENAEAALDRYEQWADYVFLPTMATARIEMLEAEVLRLTAERERLALAVCGGEDAPGYANSRTIEELEDVAKQNRISDGETIDMITRAEAENERLRELIKRIRRDADEWCVSRTTGNPVLENQKGEKLWQTIRHASSLTAPIVPSATLNDGGDNAA